MASKFKVLQVIPKLGYGGAETGCYDLAHYLNEVGCKSYIEDLTVLNSESDSVDIDFGKITFDKISCNGSGNDCFDTSGSIVSGNILSGSNIVDKLGSFGESSNVSIKEINGNDINIGVASKDGSSVQIKEFNLVNYNISLASYYKKFSLDFPH